MFFLYKCSIIFILIGTWNILHGFAGCIYELDISNRYVVLPDADGGEDPDNSNIKTWHGSLSDILEVTFNPIQRL